MEFMYEDELPEDMTDAEYDAWYEKSWVEFVRIGPVFVRDKLKDVGQTR